MATSLGLYHSNALLDALADLHHIHDLNHLYMFVLNRCCDILKAQGGTFFSVREETGEMIPEAAKGVSLSLLKEIPFKFKSGVSGWVATNRKAANVENAPEDERFNRAVDVITGIRTRTILCVPIIRQDKVIAVVEMVNRIDGMFKEADQSFLQHFCNQVGVALENCSLFKKTQDLLAYTDSVINSLSGGFISTGSNGVVTRCNTSACRILTIAEADAVGKPLLAALPQYPAFSAILDVTQKHETSVSRQEIELQKFDGSTMLIGYSTFLIREESGKLLGAGIIFQDLTQLKRK
jgi:PAS domain S-box-containing protein